MSHLPKNINSEKDLFGLTQEQWDFLEWAAEERIRDEWGELQKRDRERQANGQQKSHQRSL